MRFVASQPVPKQQQAMAVGSSNSPSPTPSFRNHFGSSCQQLASVILLRFEQAPSQVNRQLFQSPVTVLQSSKPVSICRVRWRCCASAVMHSCAVLVSTVGSGQVAFAITATQSTDCPVSNGQTVSSHHSAVRATMPGTVATTVVESSGAVLFHGDRIQQCQQTPSPALTVTRSQQCQSTRSHQ